MSEHNEWPELKPVHNKDIKAVEISYEQYNRARLCVNTLTGIPDERLARKCECSLRTKCVGDGCDICHPRLALEYALENMRELEECNAALEQQVSELQQTNFENDQCQEHQAAEIGRLEQQLSKIQTGLNDSATVYANMLRGIIATPREFEYRAEKIATLEQQRGELVALIVECDQYLDSSRIANICCKSYLHKKMKCVITGKGYVPERGLA